MLGIGRNNACCNGRLRIAWPSKTSSRDPIAKGGPTDCWMSSARLDLLPTCAPRFLKDHAFRSRLFVLFPSAFKDHPLTQDAGEKWRQAGLWVVTVSDKHNLHSLQMDNARIARRGFLHQGRLFGFLLRFRGVLESREAEKERLQKAAAGLESASGGPCFFCRTLSRRYVCQRCRFLLQKTQKSPHARNNSMIVVCFWLCSWNGCGPRWKKRLRSWRRNRRLPGGALMIYAGHLLPPKEKAPA